MLIQKIILVFIQFYLASNVIICTNNVRDFDLNKPPPVDFEDQAMLTNEEELVPNPLPESPMTPNPIARRRQYTIEEKKKFVKEFNKIKSENPKIPNQDLCKRLGIPESTIKKWLKTEDWNVQMKRGPKFTFEAKQKVRFTKEQKLDFVAKYREAKALDQTLTYERFAEQLKISKASLASWDRGIALEGMGEVQKRHKNEEKREIIAKINVLKNEKKMNMSEIAQLLHIRSSTLMRWQQQA